MSKWADYCIFTVHYNNEHTHIVTVKAHEDMGETISAIDKEFKRSEVVSSIKSGKTFVTIYTKEGKWTRGEDVRIVTINGKDYIRTDKNSIEKDNLGSLPEY